MSRGWRSAYPLPGIPGVRDSQDGLTIREELASRMLAGLLAHGVDYDRGRRDVIADEAVEWADALIERLSKP